jgi:glutaminyl-peptide cyclotransferase
MKLTIGIVALVCLCAGALFWINYQNSANGAGKGRPFNFEVPNESEPVELEPLQDKPSQFGSDRVKEGQDVKPAPFDGKQAMKYLDAICALGPRISGSTAMKKQQELIKKHFEDLGAKVQYQTFMAKQNSVRGEVEMTNIIISFHPDKKRRAIICSHYDTRPIADQEPDPRDWKKPFLSANDGGSGVALMMELGSHIKNLKTNVGVDFVIFDGEEYIFKAEGLGRDRYFIGSEHFAKTWRQTKDRVDYSAAILLDMIAGKTLRLPVEINSYRRYPKLCEEVWAIAREQNAKAFQWDRGHEVQDDHLELQKVGIPAIDIIDFDYPHWHRLSDTPANCSPDSFEQVARVLSVWLQRTK